MKSIKKSEIKALLINIASFSKDGKSVGGLLHEKISLGFKRRLEKIRNELIEHHRQMEVDKSAIEACKDCDKAKETEELMAEEIQLTSQPISLEMLEGIVSQNMYDFDLLEKIAE